MQNLLWDIVRPQQTVYIKSSVFQSDGGGFGTFPASEERSWIRPLCRFSEHSLHFAYIQLHLSIRLENFSWFWVKSTRTARSKCALWRESPLSLKNLLRCLSFMSNSCLLSSKVLMSFLPLTVVSTVYFRMIVATSLNHWWPGRTLLLMQTVLWDLKKIYLFFFSIHLPPTFQFPQRGSVGLH